MTLKIWTSEKVLDDFSGIPEPHVVVGHFPFWGASFFRKRAVVLESHTLPWNMAEPNGIDLAVETAVVVDGGGGGVRDECCRP